MLFKTRQILLLASQKERRATKHTHNGLENQLKQFKQDERVVNIFHFDGRKTLGSQINLEHQRVVEI